MILIHIQQIGQKTGLLLMVFLEKHHQLTPKKHTITIQPLISNQQKLFMM